MAGVSAEIQARAEAVGLAHNGWRSWIERLHTLQWLMRKDGGTLEAVWQRRDLLHAGHGQLAAWNGGAIAQCIP